jgi:hypothetical protein
MNIVKYFFNKLNGSGSTAKVCKTRMINDRFFECKVKKPNPKYCEYSFSSGDGFICNHQDREIFTGK